jgi:ribosomal protein S27E
VDEQAESRGSQSVEEPLENRKPERATWVPVRCPECGKLLCEVSPGSVVKIRCKYCRVYVEKVAA